MKRTRLKRKVRIIRKARLFVDAYWDTEYDPPVWKVRYVQRNPDNSLEVLDVDLAESKNDAVSRAKKWSKKEGVPFEGVVYG